METHRKRRRGIVETTMNRLEATMAQHWIHNAQPGAANCANCSDSCKLRRAKARTQNIAPLSLEGVSQMVYVLPERLLALVRPAFDRREAAK